MTGETGRGLGGPVDRQTEVRTSRCQIRGKQIGERQKGRQGIRSPVDRKTLIPEDRQTCR